MKQKISENLVHPTNDELKQLQKFDYKEVMKGISVEKEHTKDERVAARIALDHLKENPQYYRELAKAQIEDVMSYDFFAILESDDDDDTPLGSWGARPQHKEVVTPTKSPKKDTRSSPALQYKVSPTSGRAIWDPKSGMSKTEFFSAVRAAKNRKDGRLIHLDSTRKREPDSGKVKTPLGSFPSRVAVSSKGNVVTRQDRVTRENAIKTTEPDSVDKIIRARLEADRLRKIKWTQTARRVKRERKTISLPSNTDNNMNNESIKEEVFKSLNEFFGSNFKPVGSFKAASQGSPNRYSWSATPKNQALGSKKAIAPDTSFKKKDPGFIERAKGFFRERAKTKERKEIDKDTLGIAKVRASMGNNINRRAAFKSHDMMAPSKTTVQDNFDRPSIEDKPGFTPKSTPKTITPRQKGEVNPNFEKQNAVERASKAALELGKARAAGKLHSGPPPEPKTEAPKRQPPPPPQPTKLLTAASRFTIKKGEAESKAVLPSSGKVIPVGPASSAEPKAETPKGSSSKLTLDKIKSDLNLGTRSAKAEAPKATLSLDDRFNKLRADNASTLARIKVDTMVKAATSGPKLLGPASETPAPKDKAKGKKTKATAPKPAKKPKGKKKVTEAFGMADDDIEIPTFARNRAKDAADAYDTDTKDAKSAEDRREQAYRKHRDTDPKDKKAKDAAKQEFVKARDAAYDAKKWAEKSSSSKASADARIKDAKRQLGIKRGEERKSDAERAKTQRETKSATRRAEIEADRNARAQQRMRVAGINADIAKQRIGAQKSNMVKAAASKAASIGKATIVGMVKNLANTAKSLTHSKVNVNV